jgi:hypothetical protein
MIGYSSQKTSRWLMLVVISVLVVVALISHSHGFHCQPGRTNSFEPSQAAGDEGFT